MSSSNTFSEQDSVSGGEVARILLAKLGSSAHTLVRGELCPLIYSQSYQGHAQQ